jgi:hypothetical protein
MSRSFLGDNKPPVLNRVEASFRTKGGLSLKQTTHFPLSMPRLEMNADHPIRPTDLIAFPRKILFLFCRRCISIYSCKENQLDALFILSIFRQSASTCKNQCIRKKTGAETVVKKIKQYQEMWLQHIQRMETNRIPKQALQYKPKERRHIGRPRKRWRDQFHFEDQGTGNTPNPSWTWWWWTSTCFGRIYSPSSRGILYIYNNWHLLFFLVDCLLSWGKRTVN